MEPNFTNDLVKKLSGRSIFLIGMMGSGKSSIGPILAEILKYKYIDMDSLIEKLTKKTIDKIFSDEGEEYFRDLETQCLQEIIKLPSTIVSTGGGVILKKENWGILRQGIIVWLDINQEVALERLKAQNNTRPLLRGKNLKNNYINIFNTRKELYSQADVRIPIENQSIEEISHEIITKIYNKINI